MQNGTYKNATAPFGFKKENGNLVIDETQAMIVRQIFEWYSSGFGTQLISDMLNNSEDNGIWQPNRVKYILTNERYIGNAVFQKYYVTETLPHVKKRNYGERQKYYVTDVNTPIVEKDLFYTVQNLMKSRHKEYVEENHFLAKRIYCVKCGATYKYRNIRGKSYWGCRTHEKNSSKCENKRIPEIEIYSAFIRLCNKLMANYKLILAPLQSALQDLKLKKFSGQPQVMDIHKEIAKLREQTHVLARLKTIGFLDEAKYIEQTTELTAKISKLQSELKKLTRSDDEDEVIEQIEMLTGFFEKQSSIITEFDETAFESIVEKIVVLNHGELEFHLIGGLKFREKI
jgi:hypothetical protein